MSGVENPHRVGLIPEHVVPNAGRLGRHIQYDERSRAHPVPLLKAAKVASRTWERTIAAFNQGAIGSCTGNAAAGVLATVPYRKKGAKYGEPLARKIYRQATKLDAIEGDWPPHDTGSSVLAAMKAAKKLRLCGGYTWCFGLDDVLRTLSTIGPVEVGLNWYEGFDKPGKDGKVKVKGAIRGGHAFEILGVDVKAKTVLAVNSWGKTYGLDGRFVIAWKDLDRLLGENGEAATVVTKSK